MKRTPVNARGVILKKTTLRDARKHFGFTQQTLARRVNVTGMSIWRAENGRSIEMATANRIAEALNMPIGLLVRKSA